jgi:pimeloyl-ACP methyl ester carboxylesterase
MENLLPYKEGKPWYRVSGKGNPVVLLDGLSEDSGVWNRQVAYLEKHFRLFVPDLPGSGRSVLREPTSMEDLADRIKVILDTEQIDHCAMIGHSMGGYIALAFAEKYPGRLNALGLFHSTAYADNEEKKTARRRSIEFIRTHGAAEFIKQSTPALFSESFRQAQPEKVAAFVRKYNDNFDPDCLVWYYEAMIERPDRTRVLKDLSKPVLFVLGGQDKAVPLEHGLQQCHLPGLSYIHVLPDAAHMGMLEDIDRSNRILEDFLLQKIR